MSPPSKVIITYSFTERSTNMATIEKISGSAWRVSKYYKGKRYRITLDRKPSKSEADRIIWSLIEKEPAQGYYQSFEVAAQKYIESK